MEQAEKQNVTIKTYSAKDYVKDGLVALWDGIENAGWHTHNAELSAQKDLVGTNDITVSQNMSVGPDYVFYKGCKSLTTQEPIVESDDVTMECVVDRRDTDAECCLLNFYGVNVMLNVDTKRVGARHGPGFYWVNYDKSDVFTLTSAVNYLTQKFDVYVNGVRVGGQSGASYVTGSPKGVKDILFNGQNIYGAMTNRFKAKCFRIYSRTLSLEEVAANYEIDRKRFGL